jgi:hypothetical protein
VPTAVLAAAEDVELAVLDDALVHAVRARAPAATIATIPTVGPNFLLRDGVLAELLLPADLTARRGREPLDMVALLHFFVMTDGRTTLGAQGRQISG